MYYRLDLAELVSDDEVEYNYYSIESADENNLEWPWLHGVKFGQPPDKPLPLAVDLDDDFAAEFADYVGADVPLVSARLRDVLEQCGVSNVEYFPVEIAGADRFDDIPAYYAINVVGKVAVADPDASVFTDAFGQMGAALFDKFVLRKDLAPGLKLFRMAEQMSTLIVSEDVKTAAEAAGIDTLWFDPLVSY